MIVYSYDKVSGFYNGVTQADPSPLEKDVWIFPAHTTSVKPPEVTGNDVAQWDGNQWNIVTVVEPTVLPSVISDRQFFQQLAIENYITQDEAINAVSIGAIPSVLEGFVNSLPLEYQFNARMILSGATEFERYHPMVAMVGQYMGLSDADIDGFFQRASLL